ncbi:MAG: carboxypeptidase-like regulatory domain-containing protein [Pirellulaceae bacterium]|nr:carboxypeptidase regulatory-like domain-containing protein [Planctomycetales bacterium]
MNRVWLGLSLAFLAVGLVGCGGGVSVDAAKVTGTVTYNGEKVEGATVQFMNDDGSLISTGVTDASGVYSLSGFIGGQNVEGAPIGHCRVTVQKMPTMASGDGGGEDGFPQASMINQTMNADGTPKELESLIPAKYSDPTNSGLEFTVEKGKDNVYNIELVD